MAYAVVTSKTMIFPAQTMNAMPKPRIYLDHAATGWPKPEAVYAAMDAFARQTGASAGRGGYRSAAAADELIAACRRRLAQLIGADTPQQVAFFSNGTTALHAAIFGVVGQGDHVVTTATEHNSVLRPLQWLHTHAGVRLDIVGCDKAGNVDPAAVLAHVTPQTRLVAIGHGSNVTGAVQRVEAVGQGLRDRDTLLLCDAAQTLGYLPIDVQRWGVDLLASPGHKGAAGPLGTGMLYVSPKAQQHLRPVVFGGTGSQSQSLEMPTSLPAMLEPGNLNVPAIAGWEAGLAALAVQETAAQEEKAARCGELAAALRRGLSDLPATRVIMGERLPIASLTFSGGDVNLVAALLDSEFGIEVRSGLHCAALIHPQLGTAPHGTLRVSGGHSTTLAEINALAAALAEIVPEVSGPLEGGDATS